MNEQAQILKILESKKEEEQKEILLECLSKIGTEEWQEDVKEWIKRLDKIK